MEPVIKTPFLKWVVSGAAAAVILTATALFAISLASSSAVVSDMKNFSTLPSASDSPVAKIHNPDSEVRGIWIASVENIDFPSKPGITAKEQRAELDAIISDALDLNLNAIYFQVRPSADALYDSAYFPTSEFLTGEQGKPFDGGFDPLAYLVSAAHAENIAVHAWVNPMRITTGSAAYPQQDLNSLSQNHPARQNPDWVVSYADGKLYFNVGIPEARELIAAGVGEIVKNYDVDGVIFDDYFYPYPVTGATFEDTAAYKLYGGGMSLGDWRRHNVNLMVGGCYDAVKIADPDCLFGIAPFGIWQNDDGKNGGSDTKGLNSYTTLYCDPLAWVRGGYVDYLAPQIYWMFSTSVARYDTLVRWWNKQLEPYDVDLLICHAAYRSAEWGVTNEIKNQIEFARSEMRYTGSILYGYRAIKADDMGLKRQIRDVFADEVVNPPPASNGAEIRITTPASGSYLNYANSYVIGRSDPTYPLYLGGEAVSRTKSGYFSLFLPLSRGRNEFVFTQNDQKYTYILNRGVAGSTGETGYPQMSEYQMLAPQPSGGVMLPAGSTFEVSVTAPSGSRVTAALGGVTVTLKPQTNPPSNAVYMQETYKGSFTLPAVKAGEIADLGNIKYSAQRGIEIAAAIGSRVRATGAGAAVVIEVLKDESELKISRTSWYYDDYTPASTGMLDLATELFDGYYKLRMGGYISVSDVTEIPGWVINADIRSVNMRVSESSTELLIKTGINVPVNGYVDNGNFIVTLYNVNADSAKDADFIKNPLFKSVKWEYHTRANSVKYFCELYHTDNFYGFAFSYEDGYVKVSFRNPSRLANSRHPLAGRVIVLDAGHGGSDPGALGANPDANEADLNLAVTLAAADRLRELGAEVVLTRDEDKTVYIYDRIQLAEKILPDLLISVHQNSIGYNSDITKIRGLVALYFADSGKLLASSLSSVMSDSLNRLERTPASQRLVMTRNVKFPSALVEVSFMTNVEEYEYMLNGGIEKAGIALAEGVLEYYRAQEKFR